MTSGRNPIDRALERLNKARAGSDVAAMVRDGLVGAAGPADGQPSPTPPVGAYLTSVTVSGFRGIGPTSTLEIEPGPGLTLVVGRNGSGKSSFADALELLLTGDAMRWSKRTADWKKGWRNLHDNAEIRVAAQFLVNGDSNPLTLQHAWGTQDRLDGGTAWAQPHGKERMALASLGWLEAARSARPFLSYSELGSMLEQGPSKLYDAMSKILGLDELVAVAEAIRQDRLASEKQIKATNLELEDRILPRLRDSEDQRARRCVSALTGGSWDLDTVVEILGGDLGSDASTEVAVLRSTAALQTPTVADIERLASEAREAMAAQTALAGTDAHRAAAVADLLQRAAKFHDNHREPDCPVCGTKAVLDDAWREQATAAAEHLETQAASVRAADRRTVEAFAAFRKVATPKAIDDERLTGTGLDTAEVTRSIESLSAALGGGDDVAMLESVTVACAVYSDALKRLKALAAAEADRRDDAWRPIALELSGWLGAGRRSMAEDQLNLTRRAAEKWIRSVAAEIRQERFEPIANRAQAVWSQLSLNSNVQLRDLVLTGATTTRKLTIDVAVDGVEGVALGVMSQGELHGLALSLFLPRATLDESPFRFVVIDDPVQAMDPSRVDGLARVLADVAEDRQVVVFTHDERLPEAVRRLQIAATILIVTRRPGSIVEIHKSLDPVEQALHDARALARSDGVPEAARQRLVPGLCRTALEAASTLVVRRRRLGSGQSHAEVESELLEANRLTHYLALALFDDITRGGEVLPAINKYGNWAGDAYQKCNRGIHGGFEGDLVKLVNDVTSLAGRVQTLR